MRQAISAAVLGVIAAIGIAGVVAAQPIHEPASCAGYLASYANPNNGWIIQNLVQPAAEASGVPVGQVIRASAFEHGGGIEACIP